MNGLPMLTKYLQFELVFTAGLMVFGICGCSPPVPDDSDMNLSLLTGVSQDVLMPPTYQPMARPVTIGRLGAAMNPVSTQEVLSLEPDNWSSYKIPTPSHAKAEAIALAKTPVTAVPDVIPAPNLMMPNGQRLDPSAVQKSLLRFCLDRAKTSPEDLRTLTTAYGFHPPCQAVSATSPAAAIPLTANTAPGPH